MTNSKNDLGHVYWLGGSPCAGKSSISKILASRFKLDVYHVDEAFEAHARRFDPVLHRTLMRWSASLCDERWMQPLDSLVRDVIACYQEHFTLILEDLLSMPKDKPLLVEGTALLPRQVAGLLAQRNRAIWIIPTPDFQTEQYSKREWVAGMLEQCGDPAAAFRNWMARDAEFASWVTEEASALDLKLLQVEGERTLDENAMDVAAYFQLPADVIS